MAKNKEKDTKKKNIKEIEIEEVEEIEEFDDEEFDFTEEDEEVAQDIVKAIKLLSSYVNNGPAPPIQIETFQQGKTIYADIYYAPASLRKLLRGLRATIYFY